MLHTLKFTRSFWFGGVKKMEEEFEETVSLEKPEDIDEGQYTADVLKILNQMACLDTRRVVMSFGGAFSSALIRDEYNQVVGQVSCPCWSRQSPRPGHPTHRTKPTAQITQ